MTRKKIVILIFFIGFVAFFLLFLTRNSRSEKDIIRQEYVTDVPTSNTTQEETEVSMEATGSVQIGLDEPTISELAIENSESENQVVPKTQKKYTTTNGYLTDFSSLINALLYGSFIISVLLSFLYIVWGGIDWIVSGGDTEKIGRAVQKIVSAVVGLIIVSSSFAVISYLLHFLGVESLSGLMDVL